MKKFLIKVKVVLVGAAAGAVLCGFNAVAAEDYKTCYDVDSVSYETYSDSERIEVTNAASNSILFTVDKNSEYVYTTDYVNVRTVPTIDSKRFNYVPINSKVLRIGQSGVGWSIVEINDTYYFMWDEYLTTEKPADEVTIHEIDYLEQEPELEYLGEFKLTFYCHCEICNGKWAYGPLANGGYPKQGRTCAMGGVPLGTKLIVGGHEFIVEDRGTPYGHIDIFVNSHSYGNELGVKYADVYMED